MWFLQKKEKGSLGASPDGLIKDPSRKDPHGIFEAKYIILKDGESLKDALLVFFSLHRDSSFTFVQGKTDGTVPSLKSCLTCRSTSQTML